MKIISRLLVKEDIEIYGKHVKEDTRAAGYNIGDLLNMPHLSGCWYANPHNTPEDVERMYLLAKHYPDSVLSYYAEHRPKEEMIPFIPRIIGAVKKYIDHNTEKLKEIKEKIQDIDNICVHVRSGDKSVERQFIELIEKLSKKYNNVYLLSGVHMDQYFENNHVKITNFLNAMNNILINNGNIHMILAEPDDHLAIMYNARNLLLHKGGFSVLGSIINHGQLFVTPLMTTVKSNFWTHYVKRENVTRNYTELFIDIPIEIKQKEQSIETEQPIK
jgi:hypothetical protein